MSVAASILCRRVSLRGLAVLGFGGALSCGVEVVGVCLWWGLSP